MASNNESSGVTSDLLDTAQPRYTLRRQGKQGDPIILKV